MNNKPLIITVLVSVSLSIIAGACAGKLAARYSSKYGSRYDQRMPMHGMMMGEGMMMKDGKMPPMGMMPGAMKRGDMQGTMDHMMSNLEGKTGKDLEITFLKDMIVHHQGAIDMAKALQAGTDRPELEKLANDIITAQAGEITQMQTWLKEWYPAPTSTQATTSTMPMMRH